MPATEPHVGVVVSEADEASVAIRERLLEAADWTETTDGTRPPAAGGGAVYQTDAFELRSFGDLHLELDGVAAAFDDPAFVVFVSRHSGETGPLLTAHFTGNFGPAEYGGRDGELAAACPPAANQALAALAEHAPGGYDVSMECTHHGPSDVGAPSMFVELGSGEQQWSDPDAAAAVARAVLTLDTAQARHPRTVVCFGGGHYAPRPTRIVRETDWAVGHVAADWALSAMGDPDPQVVEAAFEHSGAERAVVAGDRPALVGTVTNLGYQVVGETWVRETEGVPAPLADRLEDVLTPVEEGLRFGAPARGDDANREFVVAELPADLLDAAHGIDRGAAVEAVAGVALAYETAESGNRVAGRAAFPEQAARTRAVDRLAGVLAREYDTVEREADAVVARREVFDPELARTLGVPEGPAFGRLADGEPVTVDGREIPPETVTRERVERFER